MDAALPYRPIHNLPKTGNYETVNAGNHETVYAGNYETGKDMSS